MNVEGSPTSVIIDTEEPDASFSKKLPTENGEHSLRFDTYSITTTNSINLSDSTDSVFTLHFHTFNRLIRFFNIMLMIILILLITMLILRDYSFFDDHSSEIFLPASLIIQSLLTLLELFSVFSSVVRCKSGLKTVALCGIGFLSYFTLAVMNILMIPPDRFCYKKNHMNSCNLFSAILVLTWVPVACYLLVMGLSTNE
ncbi:9914_t:CDS:1, partial [Cetraspora pellucida]